MKFARSVWKILVAIKDGLVLALLLCFFGAIYALLSFRPVPGQVANGALSIVLDGPVVEEKARLEPATLLLSGEGPRHEFQERDLVRAIEAAAGDHRIRAVALDLEDFGGGRQVSLSRVGAALDKVRAAGKPVLARAVLYDDASLLLASHASEVWVDPIGGAAVTGPGGTMLYFKTLLDRLKIKAHVFRVGTYKSAVEPFLRDQASPEARQAETALYDALWQDWQDEVHKARPKAHLALVTHDPVKWLSDAGGDAAKAALAAGLVDRIGDRVAFGQRVAAIAGADPATGEGGFKGPTFHAYLADLSVPKAGKPIAVVTIAGDIVDGDAGPGAAGGDRIAALIDKASVSGKYAGLVVRVDSPGGSVLAAERIRAAIARMKAHGLPVAVSMGNLAASGGYWVATPADRIFAEPATITGSIGIFAIIPSFEQSLARLGIGTDSVRTTELSAQPDPVGGLDPAIEAVIQTEIEANYRRFVELVAHSRHMSGAAVDHIAQGRVWDGGTARRIGLVDEFGDLDSALAWTARAAHTDSWHPEFLGSEPDTLEALVEDIASNANTDADSAWLGSTRAPLARDLAGRVALAQSTLAGQLAGDLDHLLGGQGAQAYCLACAGLTRTPPPLAHRGSWAAFLARLAG